MKTRLFDHTEMPNELARQLIEASQLNLSLRNIAENCIKHNLNLRDAHALVQQEAMLVFSSCLLSTFSAGSETKTTTTVIESRVETITFSQTKLLTNSQS